jgi:hypothetical protein
MGTDFVAVLVTLDPTLSKPVFTLGMYFFEVDLTIGIVDLTIGIVDLTKPSPFFKPFFEVVVTALKPFLDVRNPFLKVRLTMFLERDCL